MKRSLSVQHVILIEGIANLIVLIAKAAVGVATGSLAVLGDALHSLADVMNNVVAWFIVRLSRQPPDREHPYGHRKFEVLAIFFLATLLAVIAVELATRALTRGATPPEVHGWGFAMMLGVLAVNVVLATWQRYWARRLDSDILLADASHTFADVMTTIVVIAGWQISARGYPWLDTVCALGVSGFVLYLAYGLYKKVVPSLVDGAAVSPENVISRVLAVPGVREVRRVRSRLIGSARAVDLIVSVDPELSTDAAHDIADAIEQLLADDCGVQDTTIHIEPFRPPDARRPAT